MCCVRKQRACSHYGAPRSQCVCCGACGLFSRVRLRRVGVPGQRPADARHPTLRVDTLPPQGSYIHRTHLPHFHRLSEEEVYRGSRGSTAQRSLCKPLLSAVSWIWSCEEQEKTQRLPARMEYYLLQMSKNTCRKSIRLAGTPQLLKCRKKTAGSQRERQEQDFQPESRENAKAESARNNAKN